MTKNRWAAGLAVLILMVPSAARAEVTRVDILSRRDLLDGRAFGSTGPYEVIVGRVHVSVDPAKPVNQGIADIEKAPRAANGRVELVADVTIVQPRDRARGNGLALVDIVNRGGKTVLGMFDHAQGAADLTTERQIGDGLLLRRGYTLVFVGWEFDAPQGLRVELPVIAGAAGVARATFIPAARADDYTVTDLAAYPPVDPSAAANVLTVRDSQESTPETVPRDRWRLTVRTDASCVRPCIVVTLGGGFEPGRLYEISYGAANPPVAGLGLAAVRDLTSWIKYAADPLVSVRQAIAFGNSQSGRFLREFLYGGFNTDERDRAVFDGVIANIAGSARIDLNRRWAIPVGLGSYSATSFPFADPRQVDPVTGVEDGTLDNPRARAHQPRIFYTNTGVEYWGGGRAAALLHTTPDGAKDLPLADNVRVYLLAGSQHGPAAFPPSVSNGQQRDNPNDYRWAMRALLVAMEQWVRDDTLPPPSRYPRLQDGTLVKASEVAFPRIPGVASPRGIAPGVRAANARLAKDGGAGAALPLLVPQVDADGNERAGIRLPEVAVPLATLTGWNFRKPEIGAPTQIASLLGSYIPFARTRADRLRTSDPRLSIAERYATRDLYLTRVEQAAAALVKARYLLLDDVEPVLARAREHWESFVTSQ